jgi:hypothetical protein
MPDNPADDPSAAARQHAGGGFFEPMREKSLPVNRMVTLLFPHVHPLWRKNETKQFSSSL